MITFQRSLLSSLFAYQLLKSTEIYLGQVPLDCDLDASKSSQSDDFTAPETLMIYSSYVYCFSKNCYRDQNGSVELYKFEKSMMDYFPSAWLDDLVERLISGLCLLHQQHLYFKIQLFISSSLG